MILDVRRSLLVLLCVLGTWGCSGSSDDGVSGAPSTVVTVSRSSQAPDTSKPPYSEGTEIGRTYTYEFSSACTQTSLAIDRDYFIPEPWDALLAYFGSGSTPAPDGKWIVASLVLKDRSTAELQVAGKAIALHRVPLGELAGSCS